MLRTDSYDRIHAFEGKTHAFSSSRGSKEGAGQARDEGRLVRLQYTSITR